MSHFYPNLKLNLNTKSIFGEYDFIDYFPKDRINALLNSDLLREKWNKAKYSDRISRHLYNNEKEQILNYYKRYDNKCWIYI